MKKTLALIMIIAMLLCLSSCDFSLDFLNDNNETEQTTTQETIVVPDVIGLSTEDAIRKLNTYDLYFTIEEIESTEVEKGYVVSQSPSCGKSVTPDTEVTIYISKSESTATDEIKLYCRANEYATLRDEASRTGKPLTKINCRESVNYINTQGEFYYVSYGNSYGYVLADFFSTDPNAPLNYGTGNAPLQKNDSLYCRASKSATLRESASRSSDSLAKINCREEVTYLGSSGEFYYVSFRGVKGYVLKDYFSTDYNAPLNYGTN